MDTCLKEVHTVFKNEDRVVQTEIITKVRRKLFFLNMLFLIAGARHAMMFDLSGVHL